MATMDFTLLQVNPDRCAEAYHGNGNLKRGYVELMVGRERRLYDLRGYVAGAVKFKNWVQRTSGQKPEGTYPKFKIEACR